MPLLSFFQYLKKKKKKRREGRHGGLINCFFEFFDTYTKLGCSFPCGPCLANQVVNCLIKGGAKLLVSSEVDFYSPN